jgi:Holliday junction resolvase RusA-like endonuclease
MRLNDIPPHLRPREPKPGGRKPVPAERGELMTHMLHIEGFLPATVNQLLAAGRWAWKLKKKDRERVAMHARLVGIPPATGKRRVTLTLTMGHRMRTPDPDGVWKSILDAMKYAKLIVDDRKECVELAPVRFGRAKVKATTVVLEDVE